MLAGKFTRVDARYALWGVAVLALMLLPAFAGYAGIGWELGQLAGLGGAVACIVLAGSPVRPRNSSPPTLVSLERHTLIGWLALIVVALHAAGLLLADHTVIEYLKPSAPLYQLAGGAATLLLIILVLTAGDGARRRLWKSHRGFQATHIVLGCLLAVLIAVHVVVTARYLGGRGRRVLFGAAAIGALLMLLRARRGVTAHAPTVTRRQWVFGRHSTWVVGVIALCAAAVAGLYPNAIGADLREPLVRRTSTLPLNFPARQARSGELPDLSSQLRRWNRRRLVRRMSSKRPRGSQGRNRGTLSRLLLRVPPASGRGVHSARTNRPLRRLPSGAYDGIAGDSHGRAGT